MSVIIYFPSCLSYFSQPNVPTEYEIFCKFVTVFFLLSLNPFFDTFTKLMFQIVEPQVCQLPLSHSGRTKFQLRHARNKSVGSLNISLLVFVRGIFGQTCSAWRSCKEFIAFNQFFDAFVISTATHCF